MQQNKKLIIWLLIIFCIVIVTFFIAFKIGKSSAFKNTAEISLEGTNLNFNKSIEKEIIKKSNEYVKENSVKGLKYFMTVSKTQGNWVIFDVYPLDSKVKTARLVVEYVNDQVVYHGLGTSFPDLEKGYPELFK